MTEFKLNDIIEFSISSRPDIVGCKAKIIKFVDDGINPIYTVEILEGSVKGRIFPRCTGSNFIFVRNGYMNRNGANAA